VPEIKSQPIPGLCALCCAAVLTADEVHMSVTGDPGDTHELPPGTLYDVLQEMATGERPVREMHANQVIKTMAPVTFVGGMTVCASHIVNAMRATT
jgi:hypothetical protein